MSSLKLGSKSKVLIGKDFNKKYFTKREIEIVQCMLQGYSAKEIGLSLGISYIDLQKSILDYPVTSYSDMIVDITFNR